MELVDLVEMELVYLVVPAGVELGPEVVLALGSAARLLLLLPPHAAVVDGLAASCSAVPVAYSAVVGDSFALVALDYYFLLALARLLVAVAALQFVELPLSVVGAKHVSKWSHTREAEERKERDS